MPSITCPQCGMTSHNLIDVEQGYCGRCHWWTSDPMLATVRVPEIPELPELHEGWFWRHMLPHANKALVASMLFVMSLMAWNFWRGAWVVGLCETALLAMYPYFYWAKRRSQRAYAAWSAEIEAMWPTD